MRGDPSCRMDDVNQSSPIAGERPLYADSSAAHVTSFFQNIVAVDFTARVVLFEDAETGMSATPDAKGLPLMRCRPHEPKLHGQSLPNHRSQKTTKIGPTPAPPQPPMPLSRSITPHRAQLPLGLIENRCDDLREALHQRICSLGDNVGFDAVSVFS